MNLSKIFAVASCCGFIATGCKQTASSAPDHAVAKAKHAINPEKLQTATFTIEGMTCAIGCAKTIQDELTDLDGVQKASVDFDKKLATVSFDSSLQTPESLTKLVEATADGKTYKVSNMVAGK
jgi:copper chaperone CopZ